MKKLSYALGALLTMLGLALIILWLKDNLALFFGLLAITIGKIVMLIFKEENTYDV